MKLLFIFLITVPNVLSSTVTCGAGEFKCRVSNVCIPGAKKCDGKQDCEHGEDESSTHCQIVKCGENERMCLDGKLCIAEAFWCDGHNDCFDHSDENSCTTVSSNHGCADPSNFQCSAGYCIDKEFICDGHEDCVDGGDEANCNTTDIVSDFACPMPNFLCEPDNEESVCMPARFVCDGDRDCDNGRDEENCPPKVHHLECNHSEGKYACKKEFDHETEVHCLNWDQLCDGIPQCPNSEDEGDFCKAKKCASFGCKQNCMETPEGASCFCNPGFQLGEDGKECVDVDECLEYGVCDQMCENTLGSYSCSCQPGYAKVEGEPSRCHYVGGHVELFIAMHDSQGNGEIRSYDLLSKEYLSAVTNASLPFSLGYDEATGSLIWSDVDEHHPSIDRTAVHGGDADSNSNHTVVIETGLEVPEGLVVDSVSRIFYLADSVKGTIAACHLDAVLSNCTLISKNHHLPRALALHSQKKLLFATEVGNFPKIVRMAQDGSNFRTIVGDDLIWPNGVAVDETIDRIFWADAAHDRIESSNLDGLDRRVVVEDQHHPFSVAVFEDRVYWTEWHYYTVRSANKFTGMNIKTVVMSNSMQMNGLSLYIANSGSYANQVDPCASHECSHLCLPSGPETYNCKCPDSMYIDHSGYDCVNLPNQPSKLILTSGNKIFSMTPQRFGKVDLHTEAFELGTIKAASANTVGNSLVTITEQGHLAHVKLDWNMIHHIGVNLYNLSISSITYDHINDNLFWINPARNTIEIMSTVTKRQATFLTSAQPMAVHYVHSKQKLAFVDGISLVEACLDGEHINILNSYLPNNTTSLVYSEAVKAYYFADRNSVNQMIDKSGGYVKIASTSAAVVSLATQDGYLYWTVEGSNVLYWIHIGSNAEEKPVHTIQLKSLDSNKIHLSATNVLVDYSMGACSAKSCSDICVVTSESIAHCLCGEGRSLVESDLWNACKDDGGYTVKQLSPEYIGLIVCIIVALLFTSICVCGCYVRKKVGPVEFINRSFGFSPGKKASQEMSPVSAFRNGTLNEVYNPNYDLDTGSTLPGPVTTPRQSSQESGFLPKLIRSIKKQQDPKMSKLDFGSSMSYESLTGAKGSSTPTSLTGRRQFLATIDERDSACSLGQPSSSSIEYDEDATSISDTVMLVCK